MTRRPNADDPTPVLEARDIHTWFPVKRGFFSKTSGYIRAVNGVSFTIYKGMTLGLVGESGCGKTTLGRTLMGLETLRSGDIRFLNQSLTRSTRSETRALRRRMQMIFQDPLASLNPRMNVLDIVTEPLEAFKIKAIDRKKRAEELLAEVGLDKSDMHRYPHEFSGGQRQRISIARAISAKPDFIVCDEMVSALDVSVQARIINLMMDLSESHDLSYLFISHDLSVVSALARHIAVMYLGKIVEYGPSAKIIGAPMHPYTQALISAVLSPDGHDANEHKTDEHKTNKYKIDGRKKKRIILKGELPSPASPPSGCGFHTRCPKVMDICKLTPPEPWLRGEQTARCHLYAG